MSSLCDITGSDESGLLTKPVLAGFVSWVPGVAKDAEGLLDSLEFSQFVLDLEERLGISIPDAEAQSLRGKTAFEIARYFSAEP
jgi:hypothetical protein